MTVYLIEDDDIYGEFIKQSLAKQGYQVNWFRTAEDLEVAVKNSLPEVLIIDFKLPGKNGIELYESLRPRLIEEQKVIMLSSIDDGNMVLDFIKRGVRDYVIKDDNVIESLVAIMEGKEDEYYLFD